MHARTWAWVAGLSLLVGCLPQEPPLPKKEPATIVCPGDDDSEVAFTIAPFVQSVTPTSAWVVWETDVGAGSRVQYGPGEGLDRLACGGLVPLNPDVPAAEEVSQVHEVELTGLTPGAIFSYQVQTGAKRGEVHRFRTPPLPGQDGSFKIVLLGDSQRDDGRPDQFDEVIEDGVIGHLGTALAEEVGLVMHVGDLVDNGWSRDEWVEDFFAAGAELFAQVPIYPALGNHDGASPHYFRYFHLPENGEAEHWYTTDYGNVRVVALDSNTPWDGDSQLDWLDAVLGLTCTDGDIDFVFAELHHPHLSELWLAGESGWSTEVVARLEAFSTTCSKPSVHFFGHTHGYSRGQSRDHQHLMVNVSSAGGALDRWGGQGQADYPEFSVSQDTYGFVVVEVSSGDDPQFSLERVSLGTPDDPVDNEITDGLTVRLHNTAPSTPTPASGPTQCAGATVLVASAFSDADGDDHQATHWQVSTDCGDFSAPVEDRWHQSENWYLGVDTQQGDDLADEDLSALAAGDWCWRVRYRDESLAWSGWSSPTALTVNSCP